MDEKVERMLAEFLGYGLLMKLAKTPGDYERLNNKRALLWLEIGRATVDYSDEKKSEFIAYLHGTS